MKKYILGIDAGTTNIKAVLFDKEGNQILTSSVSNTVINDRENHNEQDMILLFDNVVECIKDITTKIPGEDIVAVGISGQGEGLWCIDEQGNPTRRAILWNDGRAQDTIDKIKSQEGLYNEIKKVVASFIRPGSTLTLIKWFKENQPELYENSKYIFTCKDYIRYRITGKALWEYTDATCSCVDIKKGIYAEELMEKLSIKDAIDKFPTLIQATDNAGYVTREISELTGLKENTPVSGGMLDIVSTASGAGAIEKGSVCSILGTTGMNLATLDKYEFDLNYNGWERHMYKDSFVKGMGTMAATPNLDWFIKNILGVEKVGKEFFDDLDDNIKNFKPFESKLLYLPHISLAGERAPFYNPKASASFMGIKTTTTKYDMLHSIMEGVALSLKDCLSMLDNKGDLYLTGGGAKNRIWAQIIADCLERNVLISDADELSAKGAALSAGICSGILERENIGSFFKIKEVIKPNINNTNEYNKLYKIYKKMQEVSQEFWDFRHDYKGEI